MNTPLTVAVEKIGNFVFRQRRMRDEFAVAAEAARLTEGLNDIPDWLGDMANVVATLKVLVAEAPPDWDIDAMDPLDPQTYTTLHRVYTAFREREDSFRNGGGPKREGDSEGNGEDDSLLVSADLQPGADG